MRVVGTDFPSILLSVLLVWVSASNAHPHNADSGQSVTVIGACAQQQAFRVDLQPDTGNGPHFVVTNLCAEPMTAFFLEYRSPDDGRPTGGQLWETLSLHRSPIAKDESVSGPLGHVVGQPFSDKIEITAAVWADGSTFGNPERLKLILSNRSADMRSFERTISLLQKGIQENWTRDQYLAAWDQEKKRAPITGAAGILELNLQRNPGLDSPSNLQRVIQHSLEIFVQYRDLLRQSKPDLNAIVNPN